MLSVPSADGEWSADGHDRVAVSKDPETNYEGWNFNSGNYLFTTDTK